MSTLKIVAWVVIAAGAVLFCGNVFGFFRTFPGAGALIMFVGRMMLKKG